MSRHEPPDGCRAVRAPHGLVPLAPPWAPIATAVAVVVTGMLGGLVWHSERLGLVDAWALGALGAHSHQEFQLATAISTSLRPLAVGGTVAGAVFAWVALRRWHAVILLLAAPTLALVAARLLKLLVARRSPGSGVFLYPSGHLAVATALALSLVLVMRATGARPSIRVTIGMFASLCVLVAARARLAETAHALSDVVGGVATGVAVTLAAALLVDRALLSLLGDRPGSASGGHLRPEGSDPHSDKTL
jgi:membrane-associated phospholipid phosphatase